MLYSNQTLVQIGKEVVKKHPELATSILDKIPVPKSNDLSKIPDYFNRFCKVINTDAKHLTVRCKKSNVTEKKKTFIGVMYAIYATQRPLAKKISLVLCQEPDSTSRMMGEIKVRYAKDNEFKDRVNNILSQIYN